MNDEPRLKSYIWHPPSGQCFFVSTIARDSSASVSPPLREIETIAWHYDWATQTKGKWITRESHNWDALWLHQAVCQQLFNHGAWSDEDFIAIRDARAIEVRTNIKAVAKEFLTSYRQSENNDERGRYAAPIGAKLALAVLGSDKDHLDESSPSYW